MGSVNAGPLKMEWSKGYSDLGWFYWCDAPQDVTVYRYEWIRLENTAKRLNDVSRRPRSSIKESKASILEKSSKALYKLSSSCQQPEQAKAMAEIEKLGGNVTIDENRCDKAVKSVVLAGWMATDARLVHIKEFTQLQSRCITNAHVTDVGLENLIGLTKLQWLNLGKSKLTTM
jgi:hypothetical protein